MLIMMNLKKFLEIILKNLLRKSILQLMVSGLMVAMLMVNILMRNTSLLAGSNTKNDTCLYS